MTSLILVLRNRNPFFIGRKKYHQITISLFDISRLYSNTLNPRKTENKHCNNKLIFPELTALCSMLAVWNALLGSVLQCSILHLVLISQEYIKKYVFTFQFYEVSLSNIHPSFKLQIVPLVLKENVQFLPLI